MNIKEYIGNKMEELNPPTFKQCFIAVGGIHIAVIGGIMFSSIQKSYAKEDKEFLNSPEGQYVGIPTPTPTPKPTPEPLKKEVLPDGRTATYPSPQKVEDKVEEKKVELKVEPKVVNSKYTQSYIVKKGDTFNSIVKRFKLNPTKLKQLNSITNENKLKEGQVLKFL
jgi:LysM repeat protein